MLLARPVLHWRNLFSIPLASPRRRRAAAHLAAIESLEDRTLLSGGAIWISAAEIMQLPTSGAAWQALVEASERDTSAPNLQDQDDNTDVNVLAKALVGVRTGNEALQQEARTAIVAAMGTEDGGRTLALGRNLSSYVIAADIVGLDGEQDAVFRSWLRETLTEELDGRTLIGTHEIRPNNWGTMAGGSVAAAAAYLDDLELLDRTAQVFHGWLGNREAYAGFDYGSDLSWQADPLNPVGINPLGATKDGYSIDGALPEEMRRGGSFQFPPVDTGYPWGAMQGAVVQAEILERAGYDTWEWEDRALLRAATFLYDIGWVPTGNDEWIPWLINANYGSDVATVADADAGKNMGWTAWTHGSAGSPTAYLSATSDTMIAAQSPNANYGDAASLVVDGSPDSAALLRWDLAALAGAQVEHARLTLYVTDNSSHGYELYQLLRPWSEGETTWNVSAAGSTWQSAGAQGSGDRGTTVLGELLASSNGWVTVELNAAGVAVVQSWIDDPASNFGLIVQDYVNATNGIDFDSRESATFDRRPTLEIAYTRPEDTTPNDAPVADAGAGQVADEDALVTFDASASFDPDGDALTYVWNFGDGTTPVTTTAPQVQHVYAWGGTFDVQLTAIDARGKSSAAATTAVIAEVNDAPVADAGGPYAAATGAAVVFDASTSHDFDNADGTTANDQVLTYYWDFGDGTTLTTTETVVSHAYSTAGTYSVALVVSDGLASSSVTTSAAVTTPPPVIPEQLYVADISFEAKTRGKGGAIRDIRLSVTIRSDSNKNGAADGGDKLAGGAYVTVVLKMPGGGTLTLSGTTNSSGVFTSDWLREVPQGSYTANVTQVALNQLIWNPGSPLHQEDDTDGDGYPDEQLLDAAFAQLGR